MKFNLQVNDGTCKHEDPTCKIDESLANENLKSEKNDISKLYMGAG
jgi:hypothetical protein